MLELPPDRAERHLEFSADRQAIVLRRRAIDQAVIDREIATFKVAVARHRAALGQANGNLVATTHLSGATAPALR